VQHNEEGVRPCSGKRRHAAILAVAAYLSINRGSTDRDRLIEGDSIYDIARAVEDGTTVPIYYEGRPAK
jgi:hypothetical protein